jgi:D-glycero-alpha-D-manno-heptose 1-phosphate guanylyltransferase
MKAIILAGGFGTRLRHILPNTPKPMADINGAPFLEVLINYLEKQGFDEFVISVHYLKEQIINYFADRANISFASEDEPLGTGGAILNSIKNLSGDVAVINGDTFLEIDFAKFWACHKGELTLALREVSDTARYGRVEVDGQKITAFTEKGIGGKGYINGGNYIVNCEWLRAQNLPEKFSFEADFMVNLHPEYYVTNGYFIDIGVPEDYERAKHDLK